MVSQVRFPPSIGGSGKTYTNDANPETGMFGGGHRLNFFPIQSDMIAAAGYVARYATAIDGAKANADRAEDARGYVEAVADAYKINIRDAYPWTLNLDFARGKYAVDDGELVETTDAADILTVERASPKWVMGPNGKLREVPPDTLAREWKDGKCLGVLIEESRTNFILRSDETWLSPWFNGGSLSYFVEEYDDGFVPRLGERTVGFYGPKAGRGSFSTNVSFQNVSLSPGTYSLSGLFKFLNPNGVVSSPGMRTNHRGVSGLAGSAGSLVARLRSNGGTVGSSSDRGSEAFGESIIHECRPVGNGWYYYHETFELLESGTVQIRLFPYDGGSSFTGDGETGILRTMLQLEKGITPSSHIPTTSSPVTRAADRVNKPDFGGLTADRGFTVYGRVQLVENRENPDTGTGIFAFGTGVSAGTVIRLFVRNDSPRVRAAFTGLSDGSVDFDVAVGFEYGETWIPFCFSVKNGRQILRFGGAKGSREYIITAEEFWERTQYLGILDYGSPGNRSVGVGRVSQLTVVPFAVTDAEVDAIVEQLGSEG